MEESSVTNTEIRRLVINNDSEAIIKILEDFGLHEDSVIEITTANHYLARLFLNFATACASNGRLSPETAQAIISRTASSVDIFTFLSTVMDHCEIEPSDDFENIPCELLFDLSHNALSDSAVDSIMMLEESEFFNLASFILSREVLELSYGFSIPIMHYLYYHEALLPLEWLLAYMAINLEEPAPSFLEELSREIYNAFFDP